MDGRGEAVDLLSDDSSGSVGREVARRYAVNANLIFTWLRDPRYAPVPDDGASQEPFFLPVEIIDGDDDSGSERADDGVEDFVGQLEIDLAGGHRLRVIGRYDVEALANLLRRLSA